MKTGTTLLLAFAFTAWGTGAFAAGRGHGRPQSTGIEHAESRANPHGDRGIENAESKQAAHKHFKHHANHGKHRHRGHDKH